jgi:hypothetical protein
MQNMRLTNLSGRLSQYCENLTDLEKEIGSDEEIE